MVPSFLVLYVILFSTFSYFPPPPGLLPRRSFPVPSNPQMMSFAYDPFLPAGMRWRDLFDMVIVMARKPDFFNYNMSLYEVVTPDGLMRPVLGACKGGLYCGGR